VSRFRVGDVTAEPRMEDLLASIRKAIHEDIGEVPPASHGRHHERTQSAAPAPRPGEELAAAASEIQQLREKISRARGGKPLPPVEPAQRAASLAAALQNETPRRNWRELEPPPLAPRLRGAVIEPEAPKPLPHRHEAHAAQAPRLPARSEAPPAILSGNSAQAVQSAFGKLADSVLSRATNERSVEDVTRELLRVMLKQWLDDNLPSMVERLVREEIERVARSGR
jgi:cell pole-organizing protein PopZ